MKEVRCEECEKAECPFREMEEITGCMTLDEEDFEEVKDL